MKNLKTKKKMKQAVLSVLATSVFMTGFIGSPVFNIENAYAQSQSKVMNITFDKSTSQTQTKTITIPNLKSIDSISVNTGNVEIVSVSGDQVTIRVSNGQWVDRESYWDPYYYSKNVTFSQTNQTGSFPDTVPYSDADGYSASAIAKSGNVSSRVISGSYTPADTKTVTNSIGPQSNSSFPSVISYNSGGYVGNLYPSGSPIATVISGSPADSKPVSETRTQSYPGLPSSIFYSNGGYSGTLYGGTETSYIVSGTPAGSKTVSQSGGTWWALVGNLTCGPSNSYQTPVPSSTISYSDGEGYSGVLSASYSPISSVPGSSKCSNITAYWERVTYLITYSGTVSKPDTRVYAYSKTYTGTVTKPDTRVLNYTQVYSGTVTKPAVDTRVYEYTQNYAGTAYKGATNYRNYQYAYNVTLTYQDNQNPVASGVAIANQNTVKGASLSVDLTGHFTDADGDALTYSATIANSAIATASVNGTTLSITPKQQGSTTVTVTANDGKGGTASKTFNLTVQNRNPVLSVTASNMTVGKNGDIVLTGTVSDLDQDNITVSATIGGIQKQTVVNNGTFTLTWHATEIADGTYNAFNVTANDGFSGSDSKPFTGSILVDKVSPSTPEISIDGNQLSVNSGTDQASGVKETLVQINGGEWTKYKGVITLPDGNYSIAVKTVDMANNESVTATMTRLIYVDALNVALNEVQKAETNPTETQIQKAKDAVNALPNVSEKEELLDRIKAVEDELVQEQVAQHINNLESQINNVSLNVNNIGDFQVILIDLNNQLENVNPSTEKDNLLAEIERLQDLLEKSEEILGKIEGGQFDEAQRLIDQLPDGELKDQLQDKLNKAKQLHEATVSVEKAEETFSREDWIHAKDLVNNLPAGSAKDELLERLHIVDISIVAIDLVGAAEQSLTLNDLNKATDAVNQLPEGNLKNALKNRLDAIDEKVYAIDAVQKAEKSHKQTDVDNARQLVNALESSNLKDSLHKRLNAVDQDYKNAESKVSFVEKTLSRDYLQPAIDAVNKLIGGHPHKQELLDRIEKVKRDIAEKEYADLLQKAIEKVEQAELFKRNPYLSDAWSLVNALREGSDKEALKNRLNAIKLPGGNEGGDNSNEITFEINSIDDLVTRDTLLAVTKAVERAEKYTSRANIIYAINKVNEIPSSVKLTHSTIVNNLTNRVNKLKTDFNIRVEEQIDEVAVKKATTFVEMYEKHKTAYYKRKAQEAVDALPASDMKDVFQARIDAVETK